jgi:hypothetical protein
MVALRPGGQVILIDFHRIEGKSSDWVLNHVRAGQIASLEVAHVWIRWGIWTAPSTVDDKPVPSISVFLTPPGAITGKPYRLKANEGKSFIGSYDLGMGFVLEPEVAQRLIQTDPRNSDVLVPKHSKYFAPSCAGCALVVSPARFGLWQMSIYTAVDGTRLDHDLPWSG